ncbi:MAG: hypothetical protein HKO98_05740, partial [Gemmatimonadetes bacterium]|nr:hypothetical protein [Gemmatimonadota bacterium]
SRTPETDETTRAAADDGAAGGEAPAAEHVHIPGWVPPVVYGIVTLILFRAFAFSDAMLYGADTEGLGYMARAFYAEALKSGDFPLWNPIILGGTPFLESLAGGDSLYPPSVLLLLLLEPFRALGWKLVLHVWLAGLFTYGWTRSLGCSRAASLVAGMGYLVAPFFVSLAWPAHDGKMFVTALTPLLFWAVEAWFVRGRLTALAGIGAVVALTILTTHLQMAYFLFGATGAYAVFRAVQGARRRGGRGPWVRFAAFVAISVVGAGASGVQLLPAVDYIGDASRRSQTTTQATPEENRAYAASWGMHPEEAVSSLAVPEFVGASTYEGSWTDGTYWGRNVFKYNSEYMGLGLLLLGVLAFFGGRRQGVRLFFAALAGVSLLYTLNTWTPVWGLFYAVVPGLKLFRAPSMVIFLTGFGIATLAAFGVDRMLAWSAARSPDEGRIGQRVLWGAAGVLLLGGVLTQAGVLLDLWTGVMYGDMRPEKAQALATATPHIARGFFVAGLLSGALGALLFAGRGRWLKPSGVTGLLVVLIAIDGGRVSDRFLSVKDFDEFAVRDPVVDFLVEREAEEEPFRVLDLGGPQAFGGEVRMGMWGLDLAGGHHPNDLRRYRELTGMQGGGTPENLFNNPAVNRLLNVRYIVWPAAQVGGGLDEVDLPGLRPIEAVTGTRLQDGRTYEVVYAYPGLDRARLVRQFDWVDENEALARILAPGFDPANTLLLTRSPEAEAAAATIGMTASAPSAAPETDSPPAADSVQAPAPLGTVDWLEEGTDRTRLRVVAPEPSWLVVAENYYPTWSATVSGDAAPIVRAYHTLQAVPIPAGEHEVVLEVRVDGPVRTGFLLSAGSWVLLAGLAGASSLRRRRRDDDA